MTSPEITIGLPVYNGERYLRAALDSLLSQEFQNFEVVISDNASTDGTADICKSYASQDKRIRFYRNVSNIGSGPNYRRVFELSRSKLFKWHAHDDLCYPSFLSRCYDVMKAAPSSTVLVYPRCQFIGEHGEPINRPSDSLESSARQPHRRIAKILRRVSHGGPLWGVIRADCLRRTLLTGTVSYWDDLLLAELSLLGQLKEIPEVLFEVRCYQGNAVAMASAEQGQEVAVNAAKANRRTRRALREWTDPSSPMPSIWLPIHQERCWEYLKRVHHVRLSLVTKSLCYLTVPAVVYWRCFIDFAGPCKHWLLGRLLGAN